MLSALVTAAATAQLMLAVLIWRQPALPGRRDLAACLGIGALYFLHQTWPAALQPIGPIVFTGPLMCNRAVRASLGIAPRPPAVDIAGLLALLVSGALGLWPLAVVPFFWIWTALCLVLFLELPLLVWKRLPDDLIDVRRHMRFALLALGATLSTAVAVANILGFGAYARPMGAGATLLLCFATAALGGEVQKRLAGQVEKRPLDRREQAILIRLRAAMAETHSDPGLTLSRLAQRLEVPEHRLRRVIHVGEGQSHFSAYLNQYRITAFKTRAAEDLGILELAAAVGYNSLSAFNRAFKATEGTTPSAFRAALTAKTSPTTPKTVDTISGKGRA